LRYLLTVSKGVSGKPVTHRLELFDEESLQSFGKDGKHLVTRYEGKSNTANWFAEIWFHVAKDTVTGIEIHVSQSFILYVSQINGLSIQY